MRGVPMENIIRLTKDQVTPAAMAVARGFQDYPLFVRVFPDASERERKSLPNFFEFLFKYGALYGEVYATPNFEGAALWLLPDKVHITFLGMMRVRGFQFPFKVGLKNLSRLMKCDKFTTETHDRLVKSPHWYLFFLGVDTIHQGKGIGSSLLRPMLTRIENEGLPIYLETQDEKTVPLYEHLGFKVIEKANITSLDVTSWAMLREPCKEP
jgi:ribosomal protein S18 acetylase RimI-like enzyme